MSSTTSCNSYAKHGKPATALSDKKENFDSNDEANEDECELRANLNKRNCRVQRGEDGRQDERRTRKWLGDGSARITKSLRELCKKMKHSKNKQHDDA
jgi:hypothetical protein